MKEKNNPESKLNKTRKNTNKKREIAVDDPEGGERGSSFFKRNEYAYIFLGAALLSIVIVFFFFRPARNAPEQSPPTAGVASSSADSSAVQAFEKRVAHIESLLADKVAADPAYIDTSGTAQNSEQGKVDLQVAEQRLSKLEAAFEVKFDSLADRMNRLEKQISSLEQKLNRTASSVSAAPPAKPVSTAEPAAEVKKSRSTKKEAIFHTVKKGETLYSISKKYKTTVAQLRKLNRLAEDADIYPGNNILVR